MDVFLFVFLVFVSVSTYFYFTSHSFRYFTKFFFYGFIFMLTGVVVIPTALLTRPRDIRNLRPVAWFWKNIFRIFFMEYDERYTEKLQQKTPSVVVCNHQSCFDILGLMRILPYRCTVLAKKELLYAGPFGPGSWLCGLVYIDRLNRDRALDTMIKTAKLIIEKNYKFWIYPEGTRHSEVKIQPFKKGAFHLAIQAQVPIIPVVNSSYHNFLDHKKKIFNPGRIITEVLDPISTDGLTSADCEKLMNEVHQAMSDCYDRISNEVCSDSNSLLKKWPEKRN